MSVYKFVHISRHFPSFSRLNCTLIMSVDNRSKRHIKRQNDIIQVNRKNKAPTALDRYVRREESLSLEEIEVVSGQLGYHPYNIVNVVLNRCFEINGRPNYPLVAVLYPLNHNEEVGGRYAGKDGPKPFPTTFWMTCPDLHTRISRLEDLGYINKFQQQVEYYIFKLEILFERHIVRDDFTRYNLQEHNMMADLITN